MENKQHFRGAIEVGTLVAAVGVTASMILGLVGVYSATTSDVRNQVTAEANLRVAADQDTLQRVATLEAEAKRLPSIEAKLDALLIDQGINPAKIKMTPTTSTTAASGTAAASTQALTQ